MRLVLQRVSRASVEWSAAHPSAPRSEEIGPGLLLLVGVGPDDTEADARRLAAKVAHLPLFADPSRGRRPSFIGAAEPGRADQLYGLFTEALRGHGIGVKTGSFGARMGVTLTNDGPVTLALSTDPWPTSV